jgi:hypothetical protein
MMIHAITDLNDYFHFAGLMLHTLVNQVGVEQACDFRKLNLKLTT